MDTYRWAEGVSVTTAKASKKGLFFLLFSFVPSGEEQDYLGGRTLLGTSKWGLGCKDGVYWIWGGLGGQNIARTKCGIGCGVGSAFSFFSFISFYLLQNRLRWTGLAGCPYYLDALHYPRHSCIHKCYLSPAKHKTKKALVSKNGLGATGEFFYMKGYGFFCCFSYESFLSLFVWVSLGWSGIDFYILVTFFPDVQLQATMCVCFNAVPCCLYLWCKVCLGSSHVLFLSFADSFPRNRLRCSCH